MDPRSLPEATEQFAAFLEATRRIPPHFSMAMARPLYAVNAAPSARLVGDGVLLIGDAAGLADPQSGEGIRQAVESGLLAAETIAASNGQWSREQLEPACGPSRSKIFRRAAIGRGRAPRARQGESDRCRPTAPYPRVRAPCRGGRVVPPPSRQPRAGAITRATIPGLLFRRAGRIHASVLNHRALLGMRPNEA